MSVSYQRGLFLGPLLGLLLLKVLWVDLELAPDLFHYSNVNGFGHNPLDKTLAPLGTMLVYILLQANVGHKTWAETQKDDYD